eukprot:6214008-Pleurochrysis_carterae.AAC.2
MACKDEREAVLKCYRANEKSASGDLVRAILTHSNHFVKKGSDTHIYLICLLNGFAHAKLKASAVATSSSPRHNMCANLIF